jgi:hypothetical protein
MKHNKKIEAVLYNFGVNPEAYNLPAVAALALDTLSAGKSSAVMEMTFV